MIEILVAATTAELNKRVSAAVRGLQATMHGTDRPAAQLPTPSAAAAADVVVIDCAHGLADVLTLTATVTRLNPAMQVVLIAANPAEVALAALRAGAHDILEASATPEEFARVLTAAAAQTVARSAEARGADAAPAVRPNGPKGRVISVLSPKGGVGKTTVATNLAVGLARQEPQSTVIVDLDIQFGDVASGLNLDPEYHLPDVVGGNASQDAMVLKTYLAQHESGLYAICGPENPAEADHITAADVTRLLQTLAAEFRYVVVDTAPGLSEHTLAAIDETTDMVLLTSMDVPGLRGLRKEIDVLRALDMLTDSRQIVINFVDSRVGLSRLDIEATIGAPVDVLLPKHNVVSTSTNLGAPLLQGNGRDPMTRELRKLLGHFVPTLKPIKAKPGPLPEPVRTVRPRRALYGLHRRPKALAS